MVGKLPMEQKELLRGKLMEMVKQGKITLKTAAAQLKVSYRQGIRLYRAYRERGDAGLVHGSGGKPSNRKTAEDIRSRVIGQYRLVKELRLAGISTIHEANRFLLETCLPKMNGKFSRPAADSTDAHVPLGTAELKDILCFEYERTLTNDYVVRFECRLFQILKTGKTLPRPKDRLIIRIGLDGNGSILWKGKPLPVEELPIPEKSHPDSHAA